MRNLISSSALRLCDLLFDNGDIQFAYIDKVLAFTFGAEQWKVAKLRVTCYSGSRFAPANRA